MRGRSTPERVSCRKRYSQGRESPTNYGAAIGYYFLQEGEKTRRYDILSAGHIQVGMQTYWVGVIPGRREFFLGVRGRLWRFPGKLMPISVKSPELLDEETRRVWADSIVRTLLDSLTTKVESHVCAQAITRYRKLVRALTNRRIVDAAALGYTRTSKHYAQGVCEAWREFDLLMPAVPNVKHALMVSLVLALDADDASQIIELAGLLEYRSPIINRETALGIYQQGVTLLSRLVPQWWNQGFCTDWSEVGSIERAFRGQYARMLNQAWNRDVPLEASAGIQIRKLVREEDCDDVEAGSYTDDVDVAHTESTQ